MDDGCGTTVTIYNGFLSNDNLKNISDILPWRYTTDNGEFGEPYAVLTLGEISSAVPFYRCLTLIENGPMQTNIYQCGNHSPGQWEYMGKIQGYA